MLPHKRLILALSICWLSGCGPSTPDRMGQAFTNTAQAYFKLGVAAGQNVLLNHQLHGTLMTNAFREAILVARPDDPYLKPLLNETN